MRFQQFIKRYGFESSAIDGMDSDTISSGLCDDLVSWLRFAFMAKIIIDQYISVYDHHQGVFEILQSFFSEFWSCIFMFFFGSEFFWIHRFYELSIGFFLIQNRKEFFFYLILGIFLADLIVRRREQGQSEYFEMFVEFLDRLVDQLVFLLSFEEFRNAGFGAGRMEEFQSMFVGRIFVFEGIDFDDISCLRNITDRLDLTIYDSIVEAQSDIAMHSESKVQNSAADRQFNDISLRGI